MDLKKRLNLVIQKDKVNNPKQIISVIKSDFYYLINNYFEVDFDDIQIEIVVVQDKYEISINCKGDRMKMIQSLPHWLTSILTA